MNNYIVYTFTVPGELLPFYVGKGKPNRPQAHFVSANLQRQTHFYNKLNNLLLRGIYPEIKVVAGSLTEKQAFDLEIKLIQIYGRQDQATGCLCNHTDGGEGHPHSIDTRIKLSKHRSSAAKQNMRLAQRTNATPIESFNLRTNKIVKQYEAINDVKLDGFNQPNVAAVLAGRRKQANGYGWRYTLRLASNG